MQPDEDTPFGRHLKEVTKYLNIGIPSVTGTYNATLPEEESWKIQVIIPGRTFVPITEPMRLVFEAPTWSLGKSMAAHIAMGRIGEVYHQELKDTIYQMCGRRDAQWEMIKTKKDGSIAAFIQEQNQHIPTPGEPDVYGQGRTEEGINKAQGTPRRTQGYTRRLLGGNQRTSREE